MDIVVIARYRPDRIDNLLFGKRVIVSRIVRFSRAVFGGIVFLEGFSFGCDETIGQREFLGLRIHRRTGDVSSVCVYEQDIPGRPAVLRCVQTGCVVIHRVQRGAVIERIISDGRDGGGDGHGCEFGAAVERTLSDGCYGVRYGHGCEFGAVFERTHSDGRKFAFIAENHEGKSRTAEEGLCSDGRDGVRYGHGCEGGAASERRLSDGSELAVIAEGHGCEGGAAGERPASDGRDIVLDYDLRDIAPSAAGFPSGASGRRIISSHIPRRLSVFLAEGQRIIENGPMDVAVVARGWRSPYGVENLLSGMRILVPRFLGCSLAVVGGIVFLEDFFFGCGEVFGRREFLSLRIHRRTGDVSSVRIYEEDVAGRPAVLRCDQIRCVVIHRVQRGAFEERPFSDGLDGVADGHGCEFGAAGERILSDGRDRVTDDHRSEGGAVDERLVSDGRDTALDYDLRDTAPSVAGFPSGGRKGIIIIRHIPRRLTVLLTEGQRIHGDLPVDIAVIA